MSLALLLSLIVAAFAGAIAHELAHYIVWLLSGRDPALDWWGLVVRPRAGPAETVLGDRVAAAAPYVVGAGVAAIGWVSGSLLAIAFGLAMVQLPSGADVRAMRGQAVWKLPNQPSNDRRTPRG